MIATLCSAWSASSKEAPSGVQGYEKIVAPYFDQHCVRCHGPAESKGNITVHSLNGDLSLGQELDQWESVLDMLEFGEMPPAKEPQPEPAQTQAVIDWIESGMRDYVEKVSQESPVPKTRRLTNIEYENTLSELLGFDLDVLYNLPEDPEHHYHFNNTAELMRIGPEQLDRYLEIARKAMRAAIVDPEKPEVFRVRREWGAAGIDRGMAQDEVGLWGNRRGTAALGINLSGFPEHGEFRIRMQASAILPEGFDATPLKLDLGTVPGRTETPYKTLGTVFLKISPDDPQVLEFTGRIENYPSAPAPSRKNGPLVQQMALIPRVIYDDGTLNDYYGNSAQLQFPRAVINWIEFESPVVDVWPPKHHTDVMFDSPLRASDTDAYVEQVIERFITRAYRRPCTEPEVDKFVRIYNLIKPSTATLEDAVRETLAMVLISPQFLYHTETDPATDEHYAMASRLSYFLWSCMPDEELFELAAQKKLNDPDVIEQQVLRMLADDKAGDFVEDFTMQWLSIRKSLTVPINRNLFPRYTRIVERGETAGTELPYVPSLRDYMIDESVGFVHEMIRSNESVLSIVDSDFAYLNEMLANHYGIDGVKGMQMRRVPIEPDHHLGGLLTHGSVLIGNGTGTAPHPIYRAVFLREAILGDTVAPPPSDIPTLDETAGDTTEGKLSIAQLLEKHRTVESCNDCHFRLDPWGIPFEDYNAVGQYQPRVTPDGTRVQGFNAKTHGDMAGYLKYLDSIYTVEVNAKARVPHGPEVDGMQDLKAHLLKDRSDDVAQNVIRRLLSYSTGRTLTYRDRFAVEELFDEAEDNDFKMRDIIVSICKSDIFRDSPTTKED